MQSILLAHILLCLWTNLHSYSFDPLFKTKHFIQSGLYCFYIPERMVESV